MTNRKDGVVMITHFPFMCGAPWGAGRRGGRGGGGLGERLMYTYKATLTESSLWPFGVGQGTRAQKTAGK